MSEKIKKVILDNVEFDYRCVGCGECCRTGYKVFINNADIEIWQKKGIIEILNYIKIDPKSISFKKYNQHQEEDGNAILKIKEASNGKNLDKKFNEIISFIQKNHQYQGKEFYPLSCFTILPNMRHHPILIPKTYDIILKGMRLGLTYIIKLDARGFCPFLHLNSCTIHDIKPFACKRFPYRRDGRIREDDHFYSICLGLKKS
ncbi:MAG: YkgJ family cysteine cluster protein [Candidatus Hermodarchaeota archaeon]